VATVGRGCYHFLQLRLTSAPITIGAKPEPPCRAKAIDYEREYPDGIADQSDAENQTVTRRNHPAYWGRMDQHTRGPCPFLPSRHRRIEEQVAGVPEPNPESGVFQRTLERRPRPVWYQHAVGLIRYEEADDAEGADGIQQVTGRAVQTGLAHGFTTCA
jgi:hypothetical protein